MKYENRKILNQPKSNYIVTNVQPHNNLWLDIVINKKNNTCIWIKNNITI